MKNQILLLIITASIISFMASCHKPDKTPKYYLPQNLKDYVMYPVGSYWVYKDSVSGATDSIVLTKQETYIEAPNHVWDFYWENLSQEFYSSSYTSFNGVGGIYFENPLTYFYSVWGQYYSTDNGFSGSSNIEYSYNDSLKINNIKYLKVKQFKVLISNTTIYWSLGVGIIRKEEHSNNKIWNLQSFHLNY